MSADTSRASADTPEPHAGGAPKCRAKSKTSGQRCGNFAIRGATTCRIHGGKAPQVQRAAAIRVAEAEAERALAKLRPTARRVDNPLEAIRDYAGEVLGWYDLAAEKARQLEAWTVGDNAMPRGELVLLQRFMAEARQTLDAVGRLNLDARLAAMFDRFGRDLGAVLEGACGRAVAAGMPEVWVPVLREALAAEIAAALAGRTVIDGEAA